MAKKFDVLCHDYSIGMGPAIYKKKGKETTFCVRAIPIGGFVSMAGEEATDDFTKVGTKVGLNLEDDIVTEIILDDAKDCMVRGEINDKDLDGKDGKDLYITLMDDMGETHYYQVSETATYVFEKNETVLTQFVLISLINFPLVGKLLVVALANVPKIADLKVFLSFACTSKIPNLEPVFKSTAPGIVASVPH